MLEPERKTNRLIHEKSPYLLQHAYNPVDWYPWSQEAFDRARKEDKPIFVSIGYSTCHWCHVMEKESFEDEEIAQLMNNNFVNIKVDREERPDLDAVYMGVCQSMGRSCGWPLNVIMTPNKNPFFVASYIPKDNRYGTVGMLSLIPQIAETWKTRKAEMESIGAEIKKELAMQVKAKPPTAVDTSVLDDAYEQLFLRFDQEYGGFGRAPKFPSPHILMFLMRYYNRTKEKAALTMVEKTLRAMRLGGLFDQIGFGFHRYSTDAKWIIPHFEKMLYDQALLTLAYIEAFQVTGSLKFKIAAQETIEYVLRDLSDPQGGFYSAVDADSEGEEGKFYVWTLDEIKQALTSKESDLAIKIFNVLPEGNFSEPLKGRSGKNILYLFKPIDQLASDLNLTTEQLIVELGKITSKLFKARETRIHPSKDDKILVDWNGLMIAALSRAGQVFGENKYIREAKKTADFLLSEMKTDGDRLFHRFAKGEKAIDGFLDDYAFLAFGLSEIYEATFEEEYLDASIDLTKIMIDEFWDKQDGGFFFAKNDIDEAIPRMKQSYDGAIPSGNSVALLNLLRLSRFGGEVSFEKYAAKLLETFSIEINNQPIGHTFMLVGLDFALGSTFNVIIVGDLSEKDTISMVNALREKYIPNLTVTLRKPEENALKIGYKQIDGKATAYVCRDQTCMPPTKNVDKMLELLSS